MELIWVTWAVFGLIVGVLIGVLVKEKPDGNCDVGNSSIGDDRERRSMDRRPTPEEIERVLYYFRTGASFRERVVIDFLIDKETKDEAKKEIY